jgi:hypothetical protein
MLWGKCCYVLLRCKKECLQPLSWASRGKLENISVIANDSILIEVRVCMCVINELSFGTLRKYFYSLFFHRIFLHFPSLALLSLPHHYTTLPSDLLLPSSFYSHFKIRCLTTIAEAAVVSKEHQPTTLSSNVS